MVAIIYLFIAIVALEIVLVLRSVSHCVVRFNENVFGEGLERITPNGFRYCAFTGIPYAKKPIGNNRFEQPKKITFWEGKKQFTENANICVQMSYETFEVIGDEDCLYLNIYTALSGSIINNATHLRPVMFWIHGGSFNLGSGGSDINGPDYILEKDIVVVTINYRLGPLGFLSYGNVTRNIGLHDQRMALKWVYDNIVHFGGNPKKITLSGWSAGAASVSYHLYSRSSKNLFDKAIMMSGNMLNPWAFEHDVDRCTYELLKKLNIQNSTYVLDELKVIDAYDLIPPIFSYNLKIDFFGSQQFCFIPTIDKEFLLRSPHILFHRKPASNIPILIGLTSLESEWNMSFESSNTRYPNKNQSIPNLIYHFMAQVFKNNNDRIKEFNRSLQHTADMSYGIYKFIQQYANKTRQKNIFLYRFAFDGKFGNFKDDVIIDEVYGAAHGDDLGYLFRDFLDEGTTRYDSINLTSEILTRERIVTMWTNFMKFGNPTPTHSQLFSNITWPSFNNKLKLFLNIDVNITYQQLNDSDAAFQLWDSIYQCLYYVKNSHGHINFHIMEGDGDFSWKNVIMKYKKSALRSQM